MEKQRRVRRSWGGKIAVILVLSFLLSGAILLGTVVHTQLAWKNFQLDFALAISDQQREGGWLKAESPTETAKVCPDNAYHLLKLMQTARAASTRDVSRRNPALEQLKLTFGTGEQLTISLSEQGTVHVHMTGRDGREQTFRLGKCDYSKIQRLTSIEGAAYENEPWTGRS